MYGIKNLGRLNLEQYQPHSQAIRSINLEFRTDLETILGRYTSVSVKHYSILTSTNLQLMQELKKPLFL